MRMSEPLMWRKPSSSPDHILQFTAMAQLPLIGVNEFPGSQGGDNDPPFGNIFSRFAGYNEWAKNNRIVVLDPQVQAENYWPVNPQGCRDWWGFLYTGGDYATLSCKQIKAVAQMINTLVQEDLLEVPTEHAGQP